MSRQNGEQDSSYFEEQRNVLVQEIGLSLEQVLQNLNKLNRSIEGITAVGNEFQSVEALWSHFEGVMGKEAVEQKKEEGVGNADAQSSTSSQKQ